MAKNFTTLASKFLISGVSTGVDIYQEKSTLVATCGKCGSDIYWDGHNWYCSSMDDTSSCQTLFKTVSESAHNSRYFLETRSWPIESWVSKWLDVPEEDLIIEVTNS